MKNDMTTGKPSKLLIGFIIPLLISAVFQQMYTMFDSVIAGRAISKDALAAVGVSYPITMIFMSVAIGSSMGASVVVSQLFGARRYGELKTAVATALSTIVGISLILTVVGKLTSVAMLRFLKTPDNIMADSTTYLDIYIYGLVFLFLYNMVTGIFQALGNSKIPLYLLIGSSIGNIILDIVFVVNFHMGVAGVGWATFLAQGVSAVVSFVLLLFYLKKLGLEGEWKKYSLSMLGRISMIAFPGICQQSFVSVGNLFVQSVINRYGSDVIAGYNVGLKINMFIITCSFSFGNGLGSFAAQNLGAGRIDRVFEGFKAARRMIYIYIIPCVLISVFGARFLAGLFLQESDVVALDTAVTFLRIVSPFYLILMMKFVCDNILKASASMGEFMVTTFSDLIFRVAFAYILAPPFGSTGIWCAWPVGWCVGSFFAIVFYYRKKWMKNWVQPAP